MPGTERSPLKHLLRQRLNERGIDIPETPSGEHVPGKLLFRGSDDKAPLFTGKMHPHGGEMSSAGVFFADSMPELIVPHGGIIYVFARDTVASSWVAFPSEKYDEVMKAIPNEPGQESLRERLRRSSLSAMFELEGELYQRHPVYQSRRGIATAHQSVSVADAMHIFVTSGFLTPEELARVPEDIRRKIQGIDWSN